jgi:hypothetical protein
MKISGDHVIYLFFLSCCKELLCAENSLEAVMALVVLLSMGQGSIQPDSSSRELPVWADVDNITVSHRNNSRRMNPPSLDLNCELPFFNDSINYIFR